MKFDSKFEKAVSEASGLDKYEGDPIPYTLNYHPDFKGEGYYVEAKGYFRLEAVRKTLAVLKSNPGIDLRFIFQNPNSKLGGRKRMTCKDFANKHNLLWSTVEDIKKGIWHGQTA